MGRAGVEGPEGVETPAGAGPPPRWRAEGPSVEPALRRVGAV